MLRPLLRLVRDHPILFVLVLAGVVLAQSAADFIDGIFSLLRLNSMLRKSSICSVRCVICSDCLEICSD